MTTPNHTPDLSPANLACVLRREAIMRRFLAERDSLRTAHMESRAAYLESLAYALEGQGMTPTLPASILRASNGLFVTVSEPCDPIKGGHPFVDALPLGESTPILLCLKAD